MTFKQIGSQPFTPHMKELQKFRLEIWRFLQEIKHLRLSHLSKSVPWYQTDSELQLCWRLLKTGQGLKVNAGTRGLQPYTRRWCFLALLAFLKSKLQTLFLSSNENLLWYFPISVNIHVIDQLYDCISIWGLLSWTLISKILTGAAGCAGLLALNNQIRSSLSRSASPSSEYCFTSLSNWALILLNAL